MVVEPHDDVSNVMAAIVDTDSCVDPALLRPFVEELLHWNSQLGLVSKRDTPTVVIRLVHQSVRLWDFICNSLTDKRMACVHRVVDIGSGGGFPGIVWRMLSPEREFLLIERKERKVAFLERVIARTQLSGITVVAADLREVARQESHRHAHDLAVMMAVADPSKVAMSIEQILAAPGFFCTVRGRDQDVPEDHLGRRLQMLARSDADEGRFLIYESLPPI